MPKLRFKIIKQKTKNYRSHTHNFLQNIGFTLREKFYSIMDNDVLPLIVAPAIFIIFVGLEWWQWYREMPTPSPILLTVIGLGVGVYCFYKLAENKKYENTHITGTSDIDRHPELR